MAGRCVAVGYRRGETHSPKGRRIDNMSMSSILKKAACVALSWHSFACFADEPAKDAGKLGEEVYRKVCQACHMPAGQGVQSPDVRIPALAHNPALGAGIYPAHVVLNGRGAMPWFNGVLTIEQITAVANYVRTHFGNNFTPPL